MMTKAEELACRIRDGQDPDGQMMLALLAQMQGLTIVTAKPFVRSGFVDSEELPSIAFLAASEGVRKWDPDGGMSFASYYKMCLLTEILRGSGAAVHVPYGVRSRIRQYRQYLNNYGGESPSDPDVCKDLGITGADLQQIRMAEQALYVSYLDAPVSDDEDAITVVETIPDGITDVETTCLEQIFRAELAEAFSEALESLPEEERQTIWMLYSENLTQTQAALRMQIPVTEVRRRQRRALQRLRDERRGLAGFLSELSPTRHTGLQSWKDSGDSQPEHMVMAFESNNRPWRDRANDFSQPLHCKPCPSGEAQR